MSTVLTELFEEEYRELRPRAPIPPFDIRFRRFTSLNTTIRLREGKLHEVYYWCDICSIRRGEKMTCECCGGPMELREEPLKK